MASIRKRPRKDGTTTWQVLWREDGQQQGHTAYTEDEAKLWKHAIESTGSWGAANKVIKAAAAGSYTVTRAVQDHISLLLKPSPQTIHNYRAMLENHIKDSIGAVAVTDLSEQEVASWVRGMMRKGLSPKTIKNVHGLISAALERCVPKRIQVNPCHGIDLPGTEHAEDKIHFLTYNDFMRIHAALPDQYKVFALFLVVTGARFGEATAVTVGDLVLDARPATVRLNKAWKRDGSTGYVIGAPKTATSKRTVALGPTLAAELKALVEGRASTELVFTNERGQRIKQPVFWRVWTDRIAKIRELDPAFPTPRVHDLRHSSASWLIQSGYDLFKVARRLGHANTNMVDKVYGHLMPEGMAEGARHIEDAMRPKELEQPDEDA